MEIRQSQPGTGEASNERKDPANLSYLEMIDFSDFFDEILK